MFSVFQMGSVGITISYKCSLSSNSNATYLKYRKQNLALIIDHTKDFGIISLNTIYLNNNKIANFENNLDLADVIDVKVNIRRIFRKGCTTS